MTRRALFFAMVYLFQPGTTRAIEIVSPVAGTVVSPGERVRVRIAPSPGETILRFTVLTDDGRFDAPVGANVADVSISLEAVGPTLITAFAVLSGGSVDLAILELVADPGPLATLVVSAPPVLVRIGQVAPVGVTGVFRDGIARDLTLPETGTSYDTSDEGVLAVHGSGLIQARSRGRAQLLVSSRGRTRTVNVRVDVPSPPDNAIPIADPGPDQLVGAEELVELSALSSSDPDGGALRYRWTQESGTVVILHGGGTAQPFFISPAASNKEALSFSLVVVDERGAESLPVVTRVTVTP